MDKPLFLRSNYLYLSGLMILAAGMPLSLFMMSISQFVLAGSFFLEGNPAEKFRRFYLNKAAMLIAGIWLMHVVGLLWTSDVHQGWNDIRIKLPILVLTVIIAGSEPLSPKQFRLVLGCFIGAVFAGTIVSTAVLTGVIHRNVVDIRDIFIFKISHIRFALFTCISIFSLLYFIFSPKENLNRVLKLLLAILIIWLFVFLFIAESLTGLLISISLSVGLLLFIAWKKQNPSGRMILIALGCVMTFAVFFYLFRIYEEYNSVKVISIDMNAKTAQGNAYTFDLANPEIENGYPAYIYMCEPELRSAWNSRSSTKYDSLDNKAQPIKYTIIRFLASKGLRKDAAAVMQLSDGEVRSIEKGIPNVSYQDPSLKTRLLEVAWEFNQYMKGGDPNGHSLMQRIESWKASLHVIKNNFFSGVGTGDLPAEIHSQYALMHSKLDPGHYLRSHNQYLAIAIAFGIFGLLYFITAIVYPVLIPANRNYFYMVFFFTLVLSMLTEDTLETQAGATFFAFFNAFFLYAKTPESTGKP